MLKTIVTALAIWSTSVLCQDAEHRYSYGEFGKLLDLQSICDSIPDIVNQECTKQLFESCRNVSVLFEMFDASSKFPYTSLMRASRLDFGDYDQCMDIDHTFDEGRILGKHCLAGLLVPDPNNLLNPKEWFKLSVCKPDKCTAQDYNILFNASEIFNLSIALNLFNDGACFTKEYNADVTAYDIITTCVICVIIGLIIISTVYDVRLTRSGRKPRHPLYISFSAYSNMTKLLQTPKHSREQIIVFNGLKVFSMLWIIYGHGAIGWRQIPLVNKNYFDWFNQQLYIFYISSAYLAVDTFFYISGFLLAWSYMKLKDKPLNSQIAAIPIGYLYRYLRLTPAVIALLIVQMSIFGRMGSGPLWHPTINTVQGACRKYWWAAIFYFQNYHNPDELCMLHTWYLSADMQMFFLSPIVLIPLAILLRNPKRLIPGMIAMLVLNIILTAVPIWIKLHFRDYDNDYDTHSRLVGYFMGVMFGAFMRETKDRPFLGKKMAEQKLRILNLSIWSVMLTGMTALFLVGQALNIKNEYESLSVFQIVKRPCWTIILSWIVYSCYYGYGGIVNWLLSRPIIQVGGKISYCVYLVHGLVIVYNIITNRNKLYFSDYTIFYAWCGHFVLSMILAIFWTIAFESPFIVIQTYLLRGGGKKK